MTVIEKVISNFEKSTTLKQDVTFRNAKFESVHRWFPYLEGFAEKFIEDILKGLSEKPQTIYEPFAGSGTLPVYSITNNIDLFYSEINPFLQQLIQIKIDIISSDKNIKENLVEVIDNLIEGFFDTLKKYKPSQQLALTYRKVFLECKYFDETNFDMVLRFKSFIENQSDSYLKEILQIAACEALLHSSYLKRAGDIRYKKGKELNNIDVFYDRVIRNLKRISEDLKEMKQCDTSSEICFTPNAKIFDTRFENKIDIVITSPPYLNGTNYIRNTKLELWFLGYLKEKSDLGYYRKLVVTAGINDVSREKKEIDLPSLKSILNNPSLWYDKRIPKMINDYFFDMKQVFDNTYKYVRHGGRVFVDIGDSIYGGVHIKTDEILIEMLERSGFKITDNIKLRERKSKGGEMVKQTLIVGQKI